MEEHALPVGNPVATKPGLTSVVEFARIMAHFFLVAGFLSVFVSIGSSSAVPILICGGGFLLSYFAWVGLVLFGFMNFSLGAMLAFVLGLGACISLLMSGAEPLIALGALGLLILGFATVIPVSAYDPTTVRKKVETKRRWTPSTLLLISLPVLFILFAVLGEIMVPVLMFVGVLAFIFQCSIPEADRRDALPSDQGPDVGRES